VKYTFRFEPVFGDLALAEEAEKVNQHLIGFLK